MIASASSSACNFCGAEEQRAINVGVYDSITVTRAGQTSRLQLGARVGDTEITRPTFDSVFTAVDKGLNANRSVILSLGGTDPATGEIVLASFILPSDLRKGAQYTVTSTFNIEPGFSTTPLSWGTRGANGSNAVLGFTTSTYTFPPANFTINYRATSASGTITVTNRGSGFVELQLAIQFTDASGRPGSMTGRIQATAERYTPPCFS
ncbi:MAG TPA: hypothetical protein VM100_08455 [Longimicrobiales bacterium]|nr:hypothetical protein [Longimicrobiales bacterium]